ncbi:hypothetical protein BLOT_009253 [Blomia tropicalis]|nr:hypothetical protein BLOT_009253 [Blomia tropicalis]
MALNNKNNFNDISKYLLFAETCPSCTGNEENWNEEVDFMSAPNADQSNNKTGKESKNTDCHGIIKATATIQWVEGGRYVEHLRDETINFLTEGFKQ